MNKRTLMSLLLLLALSTVLSACGGGGSETIKIGVIAPLTGDIPKVGESTKNAAEMAVKEINEAGGIDVGGTKYQVEIVIEDNEAKAESSVAAATKLITQDEVLAIIGPQSSKQAVPTGEVANERETVMISPWSTNPDTTKDRPWVFRVAFLDPFQGPVLAGFANKEYAAQTAAVLYDVSSDYPKGLAENFRDGFEAQGGTIVAYESFTTGDTDFSAQLTKIAEANPDVIFSPQYYNEVPLIVQQAQELGIAAPIMGSDSWGTPDLLDLCGVPCEGLFLSSHFARDIATNVAQNFIQDYEAQHGDSDDVAGLTYDGFQLLFKAIENAGSTDKTAIRDALAAIEYEGVTGKMSFDEQGDPSKCAVIIQIKDAQFSYYDQACP